MFSSVLSAAVVGMECHPVFVEADVSDGLPTFNMVGYLSTQVREAQDRVRTSIRNMGIALPPKRITVNLAPADIRKEGTRFDLPIAAAILASLGYMEKKDLENLLIVGELSLDGTVHPVPGILAIVEMAKTIGCRGCVIPAGNVREGRIIGDIPVWGVKHLGELTEKPGNDLNGPFEGKKDAGGTFLYKTKYDADFNEIQGQEAVKRAAVIAVSGFHNLLMVGPPGAGKTMVARRMPTILPDLSLEESIEISKIYSIAGLLPPDRPLLCARPFRSPHHTLSPQALAGGGRVPRPGEITLAHRGILFLDEFTEFSRQSLEILRQPLEDREIHISRTGGSYCFPANCMVVAAMNPCSCGYYPDRNRCICREGDMNRYLKKLSKPLMDRMDLCVEAGEISFTELTGKEKTGPSSKDIRREVTRVHGIQAIRYEGTAIRYNSEIPAKDLEKYCPTEVSGRELLEKAYKKMNFTARAYHRILKTARTIADLDGEEVLLQRHISEAVCYRAMDKKYWKG